MPYKDPERKRQWEREHRERNARRRKSSSSHLPELSAIYAPLPGGNSAQVPLSSISVATGVTMGLAFLLTVLFLRRLGSSRAVQSRVPDLKSSELPQEGF